MLEASTVPLPALDTELPVGRLHQPGASIYVARLRDWPAEVSARVLAPGERARLDEYRDPDAAARFACGRALLVSVLAAWHRVPEPVIDAGAGKPRVPGGPEIGLAHGGALVVAAVADRPIGVDVEPIRVPGPDLVRGALHPDERAGDARAFTRLWTAKEAHLKRSGAGLAIDPRTLVVDFGAGAVVDTATGERTPVRWLDQDGHILCWTL